MAGHGSFNDGDYATAITYWRDAYRRDCTAHLMLVNLARAYELHGDRPEAVAALETYLERKPDASDADQIRRRIDNLKAQIASSASHGPSESPPPTSPTPVTAPPPAPAMPPPVEARTGSRSLVPLIVVAGGGIVAAFGIGVFSGGAGKISDAEKACPSRQDCATDVADQGNQGRSMERTGGWLMGTGLAVAGGGLIWYLASGRSLRSSDTGSARTDVVPAFGSNFTGVELISRF
jgi:hypothetical protein